MALFSRLHKPAARTLFTCTFAAAPPNMCFNERKFIFGWNPFAFDISTKRIYNVITVFLQLHSSISNSCLAYRFITKIPAGLSKHLITPSLNCLVNACEVLARLYKKSCSASHFYYAETGRPISTDNS